MKKHFLKFLMYWKTIFSVILISISGNTLAASSNNGTGGIPQVLEQLELVSSQLSQVQLQLDNQQRQLTELQQETIPCTPDRYRNDLCGEGNLPFDLVVSICGNLGGQVTIDGKYALESKTSIQGGVGWKEVVDVDLTIEGGMPVVLTPLGPFGPPIIIPNEIAVAAGGSIGLGMDTCLEGIKIPIGKNIDRNRVLALIEKLEMGAGQIQTTLLDAIDNAYNSEVVANALAAKNAFASFEFSSDDPLSVFTSNEVLQLATLLPAGTRMSALITNPRNIIPEIDPLNLRLCDSFQNSPILNDKMATLCTFVNTLPEFAVVAGAFEKIDEINGLIQDLPDTVEYIIKDVLPDVSVPSIPPLPPTSRFCKRFPRFCR